MAIAHRVTPDAEPELTQETGFHPRTSALTEQLRRVPRLLAAALLRQRGRASAEYWACREKAVVMDLSPLRKWEILGPDAEALMQSTITRDVRRLAVGQVVYTAMCNETGGMIDDGTVFRLGEDNFRFIGGDRVRRRLAQGAGGAARAQRVWVKPSTDQLHNIAVQGPASRARSCAEIVWTPADADRARGAELVPLPRRPHRRLRRHPDRRLAHGLHRRARLRGLLPPERRARGVGRGLGGGRSARASRRSGSRRSTCCASRPG